MNDEILGMLNELDINSLDCPHNVRFNGECASNCSLKNVLITPKNDKEGLDIIIKNDTIDEVVEIPVIVSKNNYSEMVYNDFYIGENVDITIFAGCMIHDSSDALHDGVHCFHVGKNSTINYIEKHIASGKSLDKSINTKTIIDLSENAKFIMDTIQLSNVNSANRETNALLEDNATLEINEKLMLENKDTSSSKYVIKLNGENSKLNINSKTIAKNNSKSTLETLVIGNNKCFGHVECDAIIMDEAIVCSSPTLESHTSEAVLTHEAAIGKINEEQVIKLMTLGKTKKEAEEIIINSFIK